MPRPSRNVDEQLLAAGRELFPELGCAGMSVRKVVEHAAVNLGMFHYHFRTKDVFVRAVLQSLYEEMFGELSRAAADGGDAHPLPALERAVGVIAKFFAAHRRVLRRLLADAMAGESLAVEFVQTNFPRHVRLVATLIEAAQHQGRLRAMPLSQAVAFIAGSVGAPILFGAVLGDGGFASPSFARRYAREVVSDAAIDERVALAIAALRAPASKGAR